MDNKIIEIGYIGSGNWGHVYLDYILKSKKIKIPLVLTTNQETNYIKGLNKLADREGIKIETFNSIQSYDIFFNKEIKTDLIFVAGWPFKIPPSFINSYTKLILNIHASLLPKYRGPQPIIQQLLRNETIGGVTIHKVDAKWDDGDICLQTKYAISPYDNSYSLFLKSSKNGINLLSKIINLYLTDRLEFTKQNKLEASYFKMLNLEDYIIDETYDIKKVYTQIRAFYKQYPILGKLNNKIVEIKDFEISNGNIYKEKIKLLDGNMYIKRYDEISIKTSNFLFDNKRNYLKKIESFKTNTKNYPAA